MNLIVLRITQWLRTRSCSLERAKIANRNKSHNQKKTPQKQTNKQTIQNLVDGKHGPLDIQEV